MFKLNFSDVVKDLRFGDKDKDLWSEDKVNDFPQGQQHLVTVKNGLLTDISK